MRTRTFVIASLFLGIFGAGLYFQAAGAQTPASQAPTPQWQIDAGGKMAFDVASVKLDTSGKIAPPPSFAFYDGGTYPANTTLLSADFPLTGFIGFAYKLPPIEQRELKSQLPKWAAMERFSIEARAASPSTKDQMRLMMQSLLADRFKLAIHFEMRERPVYALVLVRPGKTGPQLRAYSDDPPCSATTPLDHIPRELIFTVGYFPPRCGGTMSLTLPENGVNVTTFGSRNVSMQQIADNIIAVPAANLDRPVLDRTGLGGSFDFVMNFGEPTPVPPGAAQAQDSGPTFLEALKDQLGLKLDSTTAVVESPVLEHVEEPSAN